MTNRVPYVIVIPSTEGNKLIHKTSYCDKRSRYRL
nr:MAG TPA: hypothetical protein [Caudoviricetes sp.]